MMRAAGAIEAALDRVIASPDGRTSDMGGKLGTDAFANKIVAALA